MNFLILLAFLQVAFGSNSPQSHEQKKSIPLRSTAQADYFNRLESLSNQMDELHYWWQLLEKNFRAEQNHASLFNEGQTAISRTKKAIQDTQNQLQTATEQQLFLKLQTIKDAFRAVIQALNQANSAFQNNPYYSSILSKNLAESSQAFSSSLNSLLEDARSKSENR
jgi:CTP synthase (UTP-ammonia lyase)